MRRLSRTMLAALALGVAVPAQAQVSDRALARAEQRRDRTPNNADAQRQVGVAYFKLGRFDEARTALTRATALNPRDGVSALYLGLTAEAQQDLPGARAAYTRYLEVGRTRSARNTVSERLAAVARLELQASAQAAIAREQQLGATSGPPTTIAVMPLRFTGTDQTLVALERGLADLMVTDFGKVSALTVLERERVQVLLDEMKLSESGRVESATAVRSGRMLAAGNVVQGAITQTGEDRLQVATSLVSVSTSQATGAGNAENTLDRIFDLEKEIVFNVIERLGITLSPAERQAIEQRPTRSVQAFLAYSRGLEASDAGRLDEARDFFNNARAIDPSFGAAAQKSAEASAAQAGVQVTSASIESSLRGSAEGQVVSAAERGSIPSSNTEALGSTLRQALADVNPSGADIVTGGTRTAERDPVTQTTSQDQPTTRTGTVTIIIRRPGGL
jgi:tetratricopeptide (TPR) repeat protein